MKDLKNQPEKPELHLLVAKVLKVYKKKNDTAKQYSGNVITKIWRADFSKSIWTGWSGGWYAEADGKEPGQEVRSLGIKEYEKASKNPWKYPLDSIWTKWLGVRCEVRISKLHYNQVNPGLMQISFLKWGGMRGVNSLPKQVAKAASAPLGTTETSLFEGSIRGWWWWQHLGNLLKGNESTMTLNVAEVSQQGFGLVLGKRGGGQKKNITCFPLMLEGSRTQSFVDSKL